MGKNLYFEDLNILKGPGKDLVKDSVLIINGEIKAFGNEAKKRAIENNISITHSGEKLLAPLLVDVHSQLKNPISGFEDNLFKLKKRAKKSGYGVVAILPDSECWRDKPEKIPIQKNHKNDLFILFWGSLTLEDNGLILSPQEEVLNSGAIGLTSSIFNDLSIIYKGIKLNFIKSKPLLFSLNKRDIKDKAFVYENLKSLKNGFYGIDKTCDRNDIEFILNIQKCFPEKNIVIKNISDIKTLNLLKNKKIFFKSTISWWNLVADTDNLLANDMGWKVDPPLEIPNDRESLITYLEKDLVYSIAVNSYALNDEETFKPINEREGGISSYELVLPLLWNELIIKRSWKVSKLWKHISFEPSILLGIPEENLSIDSKRWLIFDPQVKWINSQNYHGYDSPSNFPKKDEIIKGKVIENGLNS